MEKHCTILAPAKINLYLEIIGDRPDGYHELAMVMQTVDLCDRLMLRLLDRPEIVVRCDHPLVPQDASNLAHRAAQLMATQFPQAFSQYGGVEIQVEKCIPVGAGLAGGSTNAAAVLVGLDLLWQLGLTKPELETLGSQLGSDVPFCIAGGTALATGRGEKLSPLPSLDHLYVVLAKYQSLSVSTPWAYKTYRQQFGEHYVRDDASLIARRERVHSGPMVAAILNQQTEKIGQLLYNDLERIVLPAHPQVKTLRDRLAQAPQIAGAMMSGSGPTVFALSGDRFAAEAATQAVTAAIGDPDLAVWVAAVCPEGVRLGA